MYQEPYTERWTKFTRECNVEVTMTLCRLKSLAHRPGPPPIAVVGEVLVLAVSVVNQVFSGKHKPHH